MDKFKVGDKIRVLVGNADDANVNRNDEFIIKEIEPEGEKNTVSIDDNGTLWWLSFENIELVDTSTSTTTVSAELTHITIGGKRFRLVAED